MNGRRLFPAPTLSAKLIVWIKKFHTFLQKPHLSFKGKNSIGDLLEIQIIIINEIQQVKKFINKKDHEKISTAKYLPVFRRSEILRECPSQPNVAVRNYFPWNKQRSDAYMSGIHNCWEKSFETLHETKITVKKISITIETLTSKE